VARAMSSRPFTSGFTDRALVNIMLCEFFRLSDSLITAHYFNSLFQLIPITRFFWKFGNLGTVSVLRENKLILLHYQPGLWIWNDSILIRIRIRIHNSTLVDKFYQRLKNQQKKILAVCIIFIPFSYKNQ
jgi:hypothetical protein